MYITGKWELQLRCRDWRDVIVMPAFNKKKGLNYQKILDEKHSLVLRERPSAIRRRTIPSRRST